MTITKPQRTTEEDRDAGWTDSDWMNVERLVETVPAGEKREAGEAFIERWRFQLNRSLFSSELSAWSLRSETCYNPTTGTTDLDKTLEVMSEIAVTDLHLVRLRVGEIEAEITGPFSYSLPDVVIEEGSDADR